MKKLKSLFRILCQSSSDIAYLQTQTQIILCFKRASNFGNFCGYYFQESEKMAFRRHLVSQIRQKDLFRMHYFLLIKLKYLSGTHIIFQNREKLAKLSIISAMCKDILQQFEHVDI